MVVLDSIRTNLPNPQKILVTRSSARAAMAPPATSRRSRGPIRAPACTSSPTPTRRAVTPPAFDPGRDASNPVLPPSIFGADPTKIRSADLLGIGAQHYPAARTGQFTST